MRNNQLKFETTTLWDFPTQNYGVTPAFIVWNLLQRYGTVTFSSDR